MPPRPRRFRRKSPTPVLHELESEVPVVIDGVKFTPIPVDHLVPTHGFLIEQNGASVLWSSA